MLKERGGHSARIKSLLVAHGVRLELHTDFLEQLEAAKGGSVLREVASECDFLLDWAWPGMDRRL